MRMIITAVSYTHLGSVLKDIIAAHRFPVVTLTRIFRQAGESDIIVNAHKINAGEPVI